MVRLFVFFVLIHLFTGVALAQECPADSNYVNCFPASQEKFGFQIPQGMSREECTRSGEPYICARGTEIMIQTGAPTCPAGVMNGLNALPYAERSSPGPIARGFSLCTVSGQLYSYCASSNYLSGGYCLTLDSWINAQSACCAADQTSCSLPDNIPGVCSGDGSDAIACASGRSCVAVNLEQVAVGENGSTYCNCVNNGTNWVCTPGQNPASFGTNQLSCASWATPDIGTCSPNLPSNVVPSFCSRVDGGRCGGVVACVSEVDETGTAKKRHGEDCTYSTSSDECNDAIGLQCTSVEGSYKCAYQPASRGGVGVPSIQSSCFWDFECIDSIGNDTSLSNRYECRQPGTKEPCDPARHGRCICTPPEGTWVGGEVVGTPDPFALCAQVDSDSKKTCQDCLDGVTLGEGNSGVWTSLGCIPTDGQQTVRFVISLGLGMAGGVGLLMIISAGAIFTMSRNDPKKVGDAKELLTSVIIGLLFIVFSVTILQFIGITVLKIPGFGGQ